MRAIRLTAGLVTVSMAAAIIYGMAQGGLGSDFDVVWARPWGKVAMIDLYLGLAVFGLWVWFRERRSGFVFLWWLGLIILGNLAAGTYLLVASLRSADTTELLLGVRKELRQT